MSLPSFWVGLSCGEHIGLMPKWLPFSQVYIKWVLFPLSLAKWKRTFLQSLLGELCGFGDKTSKYGARPQSGQPGTFISQASSHSASSRLLKWLFRDPRDFCIREADLDVLPEFTCLSNFRVTACPATSILWWFQEMLSYFNLFSFVSCCEGRNDDSQAVCLNRNWNLRDIFKQLENYNVYFKNIE